jgi:hypothetical protein
MDITAPEVGLEAAWFNQFGFRDRPAPVVDARESHVFEVWFSEYARRVCGELEIDYPERRVLF